MLDHRSHASLFDAARMSDGETYTFRHCDPAHLEHVLSNLGTDRGVLVALEGVFSMDGRVVDLPVLLDTCQRFGARVLLYDAGLANVEEVTVTGLVTVPEQVVRDAAAVPAGRPLISTDTGGVADRVAAVEGVAAVTVRRAWPHTVEIEVTEIKPTSKNPTRALVRTTNEVRNQRGATVLVYTPLRMMQGR